MKHREILREQYEEGQDGSVSEAMVSPEQLEAITQAVDDVKRIDQVDVEAYLYADCEPYPWLETVNAIPASQHKVLVEKFVDAGLSEFVIRNLDKFTGIKPDKKLALKLISAGDSESLTKKLDSFEGIDGEVALALVEHNQGQFVGYHLEKFPRLKLNKELAIKIIGTGNAHLALNLFSKCESIDSKEILTELVERTAGHLEINFEFIRKNFPSVTLDRELAFILIRKDYGSIVLENATEFQGLSLDKKFIYDFISSGTYQVYLLINKLEIFPLDRQVGLALCRNPYGATYVFNNLEKFGMHLDSRTALDLIECGAADSVIQYRDQFNDLVFNHNLALKIVASGKRKILADHIDLFKRDFFERYAEASKEFYCTPDEYAVATIGFEEEFLSKPEGGKLQFLVDKLADSVWDDEQNIREPLFHGVEIFGLQRMMKYLYRDKLSRHDGLHAFERIISLYQVSGLSADEFYGQILAQVAVDDSVYESGTAHHQLNQIAQSFDGNISNILLRARQYDSLPHLVELASTFDSPEVVFTLWKNLKRYYELSQLLNKSVLLEKLKSEPNKKLRVYVETLALKPESNVDMQKVFAFWENPKEFLGLSDDHTPDEIHDRKKPSNLTEIPHLDLTPEDLRDALVGGSLDRLQAFTPIEINYELGYSLREQVRQALGSRKNKIAGLAEDPGVLFKEISAVFKSSGITVQQFLEGREAPSEVEDKIRLLLEKPDVGLRDETRQKFPVYKMRMATNAKSDPEGVLAGNDTACCMPFGSGKNNVYTFNPACTHATLQVQRDEGRARTIAQSVLTRDRSIGKNVSEVIKEMKEQGEHLQKIVPEELLKTNPATVACDNVEVAPNYKQGDYPYLIETIYRDFFTEYLSRFSKEQNFLPDRVVIGKGYSDSLTHLESIPNTTVPEAPVGYSDKTHDTVYDLPVKTDLAARFAVLSKEVKILAESEAGNLAPAVSGAADLTFRDCLPAAYIEGKAYASNQSLMEYLWKLENTLIAKDISNVHKHRPNMSFKYESEGKMRGYMIAYEGVLGANEEESEFDQDSQSVVYIADLAVTEPGTLGGGRAGAAMVRAFAERYGQEYLQKGKLTPVFAYAREQTSYKLLQRELERLGKDLGMGFEMQEGESYQAGQDTMHPVLIIPKQAA